MQPQKTEQSTGHERCPVKNRIMDAVLSHVLSRHDWVVPSSVHTFWQTAFSELHLDKARNIMVKLSDEGKVIKVLTRELPEVLRLRPPQPLDLSGISLFPVAQVAREQAPIPKWAPVGHFIPSPTYLTTLLSNPTQEPSLAMRWLLAESQRVWRELQGEDTRALVKSNVPPIAGEVAHIISDQLAETLKGRGYIQRSEIHGAVVCAMKATKHTFPLSKQEESLILKAAEKYLEGRLGREVYARMHPLEHRGWNVTKRI